MEEDLRTPLKEKMKLGGSEGREEEVNLRMTQDGRLNMRNEESRGVVCDSGFELVTK